MPSAFSYLCINRPIEFIDLFKNELKANIILFFRLKRLRTACYKHHDNENSNNNDGDQGDDKWIHICYYTRHMTIHENIKKQIIDAMRAKDALKLETLRGLTALFSNELIAKGSAENFIDDESALALIKRSVKQHKDSIEQFDKGGRKDLSDKERAELVILEVFLPQMMSRDEIKKIAEAKIAAGGKPDAKKLGQFMGMLMKELKGKADGADVKAVVEELVK